MALTRLRDSNTNFLYSDKSSFDSGVLGKTWPLNSMAIHSGVFVKYDGSAWNPIGNITPSHYNSFEDLVASLANTLTLDTEANATATISAIPHRVVDLQGLILYVHPDISFPTVANVKFVNGTIRADSSVSCLSLLPIS